MGGAKKTTRDRFVEVLIKLIGEHGHEIFAWVVVKLKRFWAIRFRKKNIVVLGPRQSGKSSLICYLAEGRPFKIVDGVNRPPDPTGAGVILSEGFTLPDGLRVDPVQDVPGDPVFRSQWTDLLRLVRPHGIIYMLDGSLGDHAIRAGIDELFRDVLSLYGVGSILSASLPASLHIFLNFADKWRTAPGFEDRRIQFVRGLWYEAREKHPDLEVALHHIR